MVAGQLPLAGLNQLTTRYQELQTEVNRLNQLSVADLFGDPPGPGVEHRGAERNQESRP